MTPKRLWSGILIATLCAVLAAPVEAKGIPSGGEIVGAIVGVSVALVVIAVVVVHESTKKRSITGCVAAGQNGMSVADEKDKRTYVLSGDTAGVKPGDRMKLQGKKGKPAAGDKTLVWEVAKQTVDLGACQP
jgi:hypothetical protein